MTKWQTLAGIVVILSVIGCAGFTPPAITEANINYMIDSAQIYITDPALNAQIDDWQELYADNIEYLIDLFNDVVDMLDGEDAFVPPGAPCPVKLVD